MAVSHVVPDYAELVRLSTRSEFIARCSTLFVVGEISGTGLLVVRPLCKVHDTFRTMITVGRTPNNDIPIAAEGIPGFHAFFQGEPPRLELVDVGSEAGTYIGARKLLAQQAVRVFPNDSVRFGRHAFRLLAPDACWDEVRRKLGARRRT